MSEKLAMRRDIARWAIESIVTISVPSLVAWFTGSFKVVWGFATGHAVEAAVWSAAFLAIGICSGRMLGSIMERRRALDRYGEIAELVGDGGVADTLRSYRSLRKSGKDAKLVVSDHATIRIGGDREAVEIAKRDMRIKELESKVDELERKAVGQ